MSPAKTALIWLNFCFKKATPPPFHETKLSDADEVVIWGSRTPWSEFLYADETTAASAFVMQLLTDTYQEQAVAVLSLQQAVEAARKCRPTHLIMIEVISLVDRPMRFYKAGSSENCESPLRFKRFITKKLRVLLFESRMRDANFSNFGVLRYFVARDCVNH